MITRLAACVLLGLAGLVGGAGDTAAQDTGELIAPYLRAGAGQEVGTVTAFASGDARHPSSPPIPYEGVSVLLLPYSAAVDGQLDAIREHFRDSLKHFMEAATEVSETRIAYERALLWAGGGELIRGAVSDARGVATLSGVPAGDWLLLGWREETQTSKLPRLRGRETAGFRDIPVSAGHSLVTYWRMRIKVNANEMTSADLNERNVWLTGVKEDVYLKDGSAPKKTQPSNKRR